MKTIAEWITKPDVAPAPSPAWLADYRKAHGDAFISKGIPTRKNDRWKYADLTFIANSQFVAATRADSQKLRNSINQHRLQRGESILLVFVNGYFMPSLSDIEKLPQGVTACSMNEAMRLHPELLQAHLTASIDAGKHPFASLNAAAYTDGLFLYLKDHHDLHSPIHLLSIATDEHKFIAHPHNLFVLGEKSKMMLVEEYFSHLANPYMMNVMTTISVGKNATLEHFEFRLGVDFRIVGQQQIMIRLIRQNFLRTFFYMQSAVKHRT